MAARRKLPHHALHALEDATEAIDQIPARINQAMEHYRKGEQFQAGFFLAEAKLLATQAKRQIAQIEVEARKGG